MKRIMMGVFMAAAVCFGMQAEYKLEINRGKYPEGVTVENLNGNLPVKEWYKNGWTDQGWTSDNYGMTNSVAMSPSHMGVGNACENALTLPVLRIEDGEWLFWEGCEVYPVFSDNYTVEIKPIDASEWITLGDFTESKSIWNLHMLDLSKYQGMEVQVRFVCRSTEGYMLALNGIEIKKPKEHTFSLINHTPKFFGFAELEDGAAMTEISVTNSGLPLDDANIGIKADGNILSSIKHEGVWATGETLSLTLPLPLTLNVKTDYQVTVESADMETQTIGESFAFCTSFKRYLYVDKGTGMWCNACPNGTLAIEDLKETYGDAVIVGESHYALNTNPASDPLANNVAISWLKFYSIPQIMLNRIQSTKGEGYERFDNQLFIPTEMEVCITGMTTNSDGSLTARAKVSTSEAFTATDREFRIGYVLTRNVAGAESTSYYQKNICTTAKQRQYRYLPSHMVYSMCYFPDVTLPSPLAGDTENPAFTGVAGSLPESLTADATYDCEWDIALPDGYDSFDGMRLVAYILDAGDKTIINTTAAHIDGDTGVDEIPTWKGPEGIYTIEGRKVDAVKERGIYIVNGKKVIF